MELHDLFIRYCNVKWYIANEWIFGEFGDEGGNGGGGGGICGGCHSGSIHSGGG